MTARFLVLLAFTFGASAAASGVPVLDADTLRQAVQGSPGVALATLQVERARLAADAAGALVTGTVRTSAELGVRSDEAGGGQEPSWSADLAAITVATQWYVVPYGPHHEASERAARAHAVAVDTLQEARADAVIELVHALTAIEHAGLQVELEARRVVLAAARADAVAHQVRAGTQPLAAANDAGFALAQAEAEYAAAIADADAAVAAFERSFGSYPGVVPVTGADALEGLDERVQRLVPATPLAVDAAELEAAVGLDPRVAEALRAVEVAAAALTRAQREAGASLAISANAVSSGDFGRVSVGASWDTRSYQPSAEFTIDPWNAAGSQSSVALRATVTVPFGAPSGSGVDAAAVDHALALERWEQAAASAVAAVEAALRADAQASRQLMLALERYSLRSTQLVSLHVRADAGGVSPLELERAELDLFDLALDVLGSAEQMTSARTRLERLLGRVPTSEPIAAALAAVMPEVP